MLTDIFMSCGITTSVTCIMHLLAVTPEGTSCFAAFFDKGKGKVSESEDEKQLMPVTESDLYGLTDCENYGKYYIFLKKS